MKKTHIEAKIAELEGKWRRALADYANLEKRIVREREEWGRLVNAGLVKRLLEVVDELELALQHQPGEGVNLTKEKLVKVLQEEGCEEIKAGKGVEFDVAKMEAVEAVPGKKNKVVEVVQKGYTISGKVLRPVTVKVGNTSLAGKKEEKNE
ncbi:MAG: nucleotide exchange factor GrpE [Candidatus Shapirobacteria bacterium]